MHASCRSIDPVVGHVFKITDIHCPIHEIGSVFHSENIFDNLQEKGKPFDISWSFSDCLTWQPFFDRRLTDDHDPNSIPITIETVAIEDRTEEEVRHVPIKILLELFADTNWRHELGSEMHVLLESPRQTSISGNDEGMPLVTMLAVFRSRHRSEKFEGSPFRLLSYLERDGEIGVRAQMETEFHKRNLDLHTATFHSVVVNAYPNGIFAMLVWVLTHGSGHARPADPDTAPIIAFEFDAANQASPPDSGGCFISDRYELRCL
jgi:hypothetical protein